MIGYLWMFELLVIELLMLGLLILDVMVIERALLPDRMICYQYCCRWGLSIVPERVLLPERTICYQYCRQKKPVPLREAICVAAHGCNI
jgi:hypothetical protein